MEDFLFMADKQIARDVLKEFSNQGLNIKLGCNLTDAKSTAKKVNVTYQSSEGEQKDSFDKLIVAVGRRPPSNCNNQLIKRILLLSFAALISYINFFCC